ncbi:hypothetical protein RHMOL_Rhmol10G0079800 [Rhododendron molle]|uniref:Uncharacterized protein n=1 Tax=Rhododendron molle TaxID=49168 RepID=A0ACC0LZS9_RHOML|nr:hypothetical protein RHMOL_Rhmol10G0079800 [Rhododendron molle]
MPPREIPSPTQVLCESWLSLLTYPNFTSAHLQMTTKTHLHRFSLTGLPRDSSTTPHPSYLFATPPPPSTGPDVDTGPNCPSRSTPTTIELEIGVLTSLIFKYVWMFVFIRVAAAAANMKVDEGDEGSGGGRRREETVEISSGVMAEAAVVA